MSHIVTPFCLENAPALIERLMPVQKLSAEAYKEQMAGWSLQRGVNLTHGERPLRV